MRLIAGDNITAVLDAPTSVTISVPDATVQAIVEAFLVAGTGVTLTPGSGTLTVTADMDLEVIRDLIGTVLVGSSGIIATVDDAGDEIGLSIDPEHIIALITATILPGTGITVVADEELNTITISSPTNLNEEDVQDVIGAMITAAGGSYDDGANTITLPSASTDTEAVQDIIGAMVTGAGGTYDDGAGTITLPSAPTQLVTANVVFPAIEAGQYADVMVDFDYEIDGVTIMADASGDVVFNVATATYSAFPTFTDIDASAPPTLSAAQKSQDTTLTGWTTSGAPGDIIRVTVVSVTTITAATLAISMTKV